MALENDVWRFLLMLIIAWTSAYHRKSSLNCPKECSPLSECRVTFNTTARTVALKCHENTTVKTAYQNGFDDRFCGPQGVAVVPADEPKAGTYTLSPLQCKPPKSGCPQYTECVANQDTGVHYCCARVPKDPAVKPTISTTTTTTEEPIDEYTHSLRLKRSHKTNTMCEQITLHSKIDEPGVNTIYDQLHRPLHILDIVLIQELSKNKCVFGSTFRFFGSLVIVSKGCEGVFRVCCMAPPDTAAFTTAKVIPPGPIPPDQDCAKINLFSRINRPAQKTVMDRNGHEVTIRSMSVLEQQPDSQVICVVGVSFTFSGSIATSTGGCRAVFIVCYNVVGAFTEVPGEKCKKVNLFSRQNRPAVETVTSDHGSKVTISSMALIEEQPDSARACIYDQSYSFQGSIAQSTSGCRGVFWVCYKVQSLALTTNSLSPPICQTITMTSQLEKETKKQVVDANHHPVQIMSIEVVKRLSSIQCVEDSNFYYKGSYITVKDGCSAKFKLCIEGLLAATTSPVAVTAAAGAGQICVRVNLNSQSEHPVTYRITDDKGNPVSIDTMTLVYKKSPAACTEGVSFGFSGSVAYSKKGCSGVFNICYNKEGAFTEALGMSCTIVDLFSRLYRPALKTMTDLKGQEVSIRGMTLSKEQPDSIVPCLEGKSYSYSGSKAFTFGGCRGSFWICYLTELTFTSQIPNAPGESCINVVLGSGAKRPQENTVFTSRGEAASITSVHLREQLDDSVVPCVHGKTFTFAGSVVRVTDGCRAVLRVCYVDVSALTTENPSPETGQKCIYVNLFSRQKTVEKQFLTDDKGNFIPIKSMTLVTQHSKMPCISHDTYSFSGSVAKCRRGCGGTFRICYENSEREAPLTTTSPAEKGGCVKVTLTSTAKKSQGVRIRDRERNPLRITSVEVVKQMSSVACVEAKTFNISGCRLRATKGCAAVFKVCYEKEKN